MTLTVGDLRKKIELLSDDAIVHIERIEDVYFIKHGWETKTIGIHPDSNNYTQASQAVINAKDNELIILAHY